MEKVQLLMWSCRDGREIGEERKGQWSNEGQGSALMSGPMWFSWMLLPTQLEDDRS